MMKAKVTHQQLSADRRTWEDVVEEVQIADLGVFVPLRSFDGIWARFFANECYWLDTFLPTAIVTRTPCIATPQKGRVFDTGLYEYKGDLFDSKGIAAAIKKDGLPFQGLSWCNSIFLVEVYCNHGSDGHTDFRLIGYRFVDKKALEVRDAHRDIMDAMLPQSGDEE